MRFYAFDLFLWTPFNVKGEYYKDSTDVAILEAKTTPAEFMYPIWLRAPLRSDPRRTGHPTEADLMVMTDSLVDVSPFTAKFVYHTMHPERTPKSWERMERWWSGEVQGEQSGRTLIREARRRLSILRDKVRARRSVKWAYLLPSEWMFTHDTLSEDLRLSTALADVAKDSLAAVTDFDDDGPTLGGIVTTVPFTVHTAIARALLASRGVVDYDTKRHRTFFKGTGDRGTEGALKRLVSVRDSLRELAGAKGHAVFLSSDHMSAQEMKGHDDVTYAEGMLQSTFCWVPRGDNPTSRRLFDAVAAGCIPVVVSDDVARYLPFRWAIEWRAMILQVPEAVFNRDPKGVAAAVLSLPAKVVSALQTRLDAARTAIVWNDREEPDGPCGEGLSRRDRARVCSRAPQLYLDEMLYRVRTGNFAVDQPLCRPRRNNPRFNDGGVWSAVNSCPPWLKMHELC